MKALPACVVVVLASCTACGWDVEGEHLRGECMGGHIPPAEQVAACTVVIDGPKANPRYLAAMLTYRAGAYEELGDDAAERADLDRAIALDPGSGALLTRRGEWHRRHGDDAAAGADFIAAIESSPNYHHAMLALAGVHERAGRWDLAQVQYARSNAIFPDDPPTLNALCWARAVQGRDLDAALADCNRALNLAPNEAAILDSRGFVHFRAGRYPDAIADYDLAIELDPDDAASSLYVRGLARRAMGRAGDGDADIASALRQDPDIGARYAGYGVVLDGVVPEREGRAAD